MRLLHAAAVAAGTWVACMAEADNALIRYILAAGGALCLISALRRKTASPAALVVWIALSLTYLAPFLPGLHGPYPPTRFLVIPAMALELAGWFAALSITWSPGHEVFLLLWMTLLTIRSKLLCDRLVYGYDLAHTLNLLENTLRGKFLFSDYTGSSILSHHLYVTLALLAPVYSFFRETFFPQAVQLILLGLSCIVIVRAARKLYGYGASLAALYSMMLHPAFVGQAVHEFDPGVIGLFAACCAIYGFAHQDRKIFFAGVLAAMLSKEHFIAGAFLAGGLLMFRPATRRTGVQICVASLVALGVFFAMTKYFAGPFDLSQQAQLRFGPDGFSIVGLLREALQPRKLGYIIHMLLPSGFAALGGGAWLLPLLPEAAINLASRFPMFQLTSHYSTLSLPLLAMAAAAGVARLEAWGILPSRTAPGYVIAASFLAAICSNLGPLSHTGAFYDHFLNEPDPKSARIRHLVDRLPSGSVGVRGHYRILLLIPDREPACPLGYIKDPVGTRELIIHDDYAGPPPAGCEAIDSDGNTIVYRNTRRE